MRESRTAEQTTAEPDTRLRAARFELGCLFRIHELFDNHVAATGNRLITKWQGEVR
jgi:hypothetical protein